MSTSSLEESPPPLNIDSSHPPGVLVSGGQGQARGWYKSSFYDHMKRFLNL